jgi:hypothetical protein
VKTLNVQGGVDRAVKHELRLLKQIVKSEAVLGPIESEKARRTAAKHRCGSADVDYEERKAALGVRRHGNGGKSQNWQRTTVPSGRQARMGNNSAERPPSTGGGC